MLLKFISLASCITSSMAAVIDRDFDKNYAIVPPPALSKRVDDPEQPARPGLTNACFNPKKQSEGQSYWAAEDGCAPKYELDKASGDCKHYTVDNDCAAYCEVRVYWNYGEEIPFDSACRAKDDKCTLQQSATVTYTKTETYNIGFTGGPFKALAGALEFGASFSESKSKASGTISTTGRPSTSLDYCGYWAFVPYMFTSCGTVTYSKVINVITAGEECEKSTTSVPNVCQTKPWRQDDGRIGGVVIFVATDCRTGSTLAFCKQDEIYLKKGVAKSGDVNRDYVEVHRDRDPSKAVLESEKAMCNKDPVNFKPGGA